MTNSILPFDKNITVASNELFLRATINRNIEKLIENDKSLLKAIANMGADTDFTIQIYKNTKSYYFGDVVIYPEFNENNTKILNIYLLRSIINDNANKPTYEIFSEFVKDFSKSGWEEVNPLFSIYNSFEEDINISSFLEYAISNKFHLSHELDLSCHKYGEINEKTLSDKILLKNFSNIADKRSNLFWAYETKKVTGRNFYGMYKKWGNGVLEYDLVYSLGETVQTVRTIDDNGNIKTTDYLKVNSLIPISSDAVNNDDYFLNADSYKIFNKNGSNAYRTAGGIGQINTTEQVNTYHGTINFPISFIDTNYMIFSTGSAADNSGISQSPNVMNFTNRTEKSITAVLVIPNYNNESLSKVLLRKNLFHCQIIGRWK